MPGELKWMFAFVSGIILLFAIGIGVGAYMTHTCKMEAIKAGRPTDEARRLCN